MTLSIRKNEPFVSHLHMETRRTGGWQYKFSSLLQALLLGRLVRSAETLPEVLVRSIAFVLGPGVSEMLSADLRNQVLKVPSIATLSRARLKAESIRYCVLFSVDVFSSLDSSHLFSVRLFSSPLDSSLLRQSLLFSVRLFPFPLKVFSSP